MIREQKKTQRGLFMIHGFSGSNEEFRDIETFFRKKGVATRVPLLAGHGTSPDDLLGLRPDDWVKQVERELADFEQQVDEVYLGGISFGANLAIHIAERRPTLQGLFLLGTVIRFYKHRLGKLFLPLIGKFKPYYTKRVNHSHFYEESAMERRKAYAVAPLKNVVDMFRYIDSNTKSELPRVTTPTMILHSIHDKAVKPSSAEYVYKHIGAQNKELHWIHHSHHNLVIDRPRHLVFQTMYDFMI